MPTWGIETTKSNQRSHWRVSFDEHDDLLFDGVVPCRSPGLAAGVWQGAGHLVACGCHPTARPGFLLGVHGPAMPGACCIPAQGKCVACSVDATICAGLFPCPATQVSLAGKPIARTSACSKDQDSGSIGDRK